MNIHFIMMTSVELVEFVGVTFAQTLHSDGA